MSWTLSLASLNVSFQNYKMGSYIIQLLKPQMMNIVCLIQACIANHNNSISYIRMIINQQWCQWQELDRTPSLKRVTGVSKEECGIWRKKTEIAVLGLLLHASVMLSELFSPNKSVFFFFSFYSFLFPFFSSTFSVFFYSFFFLIFLLFNVLYIFL